MRLNYKGDVSYKAMDSVALDCGHWKWNHWLHNNDDDGGGGELTERIIRFTKFRLIVLHCWSVGITVYLSDYPIYLETNSISFKGKCCNEPAQVIGWKKALLLLDF